MDRAGKDPRNEISAPEIFLREISASSCSTRAGTRALGATEGLEAQGGPVIPVIMKGLGNNGTADTRREQILGRANPAPSQPVHPTKGEPIVCIG
jgi:hypothetical protein